MGAREIRGLELEIKPSRGATRACGMSPAAGVPAQPWHLRCRGRLLSPSPSLPEREIVSTLPPAERRVSFKPLKISARATIYSGHFPESSPPTLLPPAPGNPGFLPPGCFSGRTKGWHGWMRAPLGSGFVRSCSAHRCHDASSLSSHHRRGVPRAGHPPPALGWAVGAARPSRGVASRLCTPHPSPPPPGMCRGGHGGPPPQLPPPVRGLGSLPCFSPSSFPAGSGTGFTRTLRPGCFPINCYFLIPFAARRAAAQLRPAAGCPPARS